MIVVGLTGGIASGKSTIIEHIKKQNIPVHDSDAFVKKLIFFIFAFCSAYGGCL